MPQIQTEGWDEETPEGKEEILFKPNDGPQTDFLAASEQEVLYGGAAGGGKSFAMVADPVRYFSNPKFKGLLLRRTTEELRELISVSKDLYPKYDSGARWSEREKTWFFPSGASLWMSYLDRDDDVSRYQGQAFSWIGFDELTQWPTPFAWNYMRSRLRTAKGSNLPLCMRACVDEGEVLTENGWVDIKDVKEGMIVQSIDERGELVKRKVTGFHKYHVDEKLVRIRKKNMYMSMTPDHRVVYEKYNSKRPELIRFNEHVGKSISILRSSRDYTGSTFFPSLNGLHMFNREKSDYDDGWGHIDFAEFLGWYVAEGSINQTVLNGNYKVVITQKKEENHGTVRRVMESTGKRVCYSKNGDFQLNSKELWEWLKPLGKSHEKHFPRKFLDQASTVQLRSAFNAYALGDGHWQSDKSVALFTTSDQLADDLQEICVKLGYKTSRSYQVLNDPNHRNRWVIYVTLREPLTKVDKNVEGRNDVQLEDYKGYVYCLSVDGTENFILRQKGCVWVSGNTSNPGGSGHAWVKKMFVDPSAPNKPFWAKDEETGETLVWPATSKFAQENDIVGKPMFRRKFIPATLFDNPYLSEDGMYEANLSSLPEHQRKQLLEGNWDVNEGAAFTEWNRDIHVIEPFEIPSNWTKFRSADYGYGSFSGVLWFAVEPKTNKLVVYRELYTHKVTAVDLADMVMEVEQGEKVSYGVSDSSLWHQRGDSGPSLAEQMIQKGCRWRPSDRSKGSKVSSKNELHRRLQVDEWTGEPRIQFFNTLTNTIAQIPSLPLDKKNPEDVDTNAEDHIYDALRYGIMSRPRDNSMFDDIDITPSYQPACETFGY